MIELVENKLLSPKIDVVFQVLFGEVGSEEITKAFLEVILDQKIYKVDLSKNPILRRMKLNDKLGVLDVIAQINENEFCNIEMQIAEREDIIQRLLYYWARIYSRNINIGQEYEKLNRTIVILIADFELKGLNNLNYFTKWKIVETKERKIILTDDFELDIIELPKIYKNHNECKDKLLEWLYFLENPKSQEVEKIMTNNKGIKRAKEKLEEISQDEIMQRIADWRESASHEEASMKMTAMKRGREEGLKQGLEEGRKQGLKEGMEQGIEQIVRKMKEEKTDIDFIIKVTGLTKEQIEKI